MKRKRNEKREIKQKIKNEMMDGNENLELSNKNKNKRRKQ